MQQTSTKNFNKITKLTLVIYCLLSIAIFITTITISVTQKDYKFVYGFLLCLTPGLIFVFISCFMPFSRLFGCDASKGVIVLFSIVYLLKYAAIIGFPFIGLTHKDLFDKWVMLATTLVAPVLVLIIKCIFANIVSKKH